VIGGVGAVLRKEVIHMARDRGTLRLALLVPVLQLVLFGLIDTNVRDVPTVVFDQSLSSESRELVDALEATHVLHVVDRVASRAALRHAIVSGRARVGVELPHDFHRSSVDPGAPAAFLVLVDGSDSTVASQALAAVNGLALTRSLEGLAVRARAETLPLEPRVQVLFNPDMRSAALLIPGLVGILLTFSGTLLTAFAIVRERERGTLEQLMVTPLSPVAVVLGKLLPYLGLALVQLALVLLIMAAVFHVPVQGSLLLLAALSLEYLVALLALGLLISARSATQVEAMQLAQLILLPSILLSGYIFPLSSIPRPLLAISHALPATHFIAIARGIIVRGAGLADLWEHVAALAAIALLLVLGSTRAFSKTVS
jgi:ABC-2 type transport system permease protein